MSKKQTVAAAQNAVVEVADTAVKFAIPKELKGVPSRDWPQDVKDQYKAYRKYLDSQREAKMEALWSQLLGMLDGEALKLAQEIKEGGAKKKANPAAELFGVEEPDVGDKAPFEMGKMKLIEKCQAKGYKLDVKDNQIVLIALPTAA